MKLTNKTILFLILLVSCILRFYNYFEIPYTYDEFSALFRTNFSSFSELIEKGVKVDGHPAGIQIFMFYWIKLFGSKEWVVKLPFTLAGIFSVYMIYIVARDVYNETVGLLSASFLASLQYTVLYSQIARPYGMGLMFSLIMVYYWYKLIHSPEKNYYHNSIGYILASAACAYTHHFSLLFAAIVGLSGLLLVQRQFLKKYIFSGIIICLLYAPHVSIIISQLKIGGLEWLGKPSNYFFFNYLYYVFNFSIGSLCVMIGVVMLGIIFRKKFIRIDRQFLLFTCWFLLPVLIGFFYSKYVNPVLQYSCLIFSFPFLLFLLIGHVPVLKPKISLVLVLFILSINSYSLVYNRQYYQLFYHTYYRQLLEDNQQAKKTAGNVISIVDSPKKINRYYANNIMADTSFIPFQSFKTTSQLRDFLNEKSTSSDYIYFAALWCTDPLALPIIKDFYPTIEWQHNYMSGTTYLFSKKVLPKPSMISAQGFESVDLDGWKGVDLQKVDSNVYCSGNYSYRMDYNEWGPTFSKNIAAIGCNNRQTIQISAKVLLPEQFNQVMLVASLERKGKTLYWSATPIDQLLSGGSANQWMTVHHVMYLTGIDLTDKETTLNVYFWNQGKHQFYFDDFSIWVQDENPLLYAWVEKI